MASAEAAGTSRERVDEPARQTRWKTVILASLGGSLEIYDFII